MEEALPVGEERRSSTASPRDAGTTSPRGAAPSSLSRESRDRGDRNREKDKVERDRDRESRDRDRERDRETASRDKERRQSSERRSYKGLLCLLIAFIFVRLRWWILTCIVADEKKSSRRQSRRQKDGHDAPRCQVHTRPHFVACVGFRAVTLTWWGVVCRDLRSSWTRWPRLRLSSTDILLSVIRFVAFA